MSDYLISREALKNFINEVCFSEEWVKFRVDNGSRGQIERILTYIDNAPTVSIDWGIDNGDRTIYARPQGEWIDYDNTFYKCPDCGYLLEKCCPRCQNKVILPKGEADMRRRLNDE